jgi:Tfp pilus assembly protein PilO
MILNNIQKLNIKVRIFITFLIYSAVIFLIFYFIILPKINFIKENGKAISERRIFLEEQYIRVRNFKQNNEEMKLVDEDIDKLDEVFVNYNEDLQFIETLENLASDNNINQKISLGKVESEGKDEFEEITLEISAEGSFLNIMKYLISLETLNYYINISFLDISKVQTIVEKDFSENRVGILNNVICKIKADTYWK